MSWVDVCAVEDVDEEDVIEVEVDGHTLAIYRSPADRFYATDGLCTHGFAHLADGLVMGSVIECPKHNGRFDYTTGEAIRVPCLEALTVYAVRRDGDRVLVELPLAGGSTVTP